MATAKNTNAVFFALARPGQVGEDCTHLTLWTAENGGDYLQTVALSNNPDPLALDERFEIAAEALTINQDKAASESNAQAIRAVRGRILGGVWAQAHNGAPGNLGTNNVIAGIGRVQIAQAGFTVAA